MKGILNLVKEVVLKGADTIKQQYGKLDDAAARKAKEVRDSRTSSEGK